MVRVWVQLELVPPVSDWPDVVLQRRHAMGAELVVESRQDAGIDFFGFVLCTPLNRA